ncbi:hypothetical protein ScPMuIL_014293 [Solemya velum]
MAPSPVDELALLDLERSNKGASKQRRDQINSEIATMRDLLPLAETARQRLSQLQIMSLSCVYIRKCNILKKLVQSSPEFSETKIKAEASCDFSEALTGFLLVTTRDGKLVYISENVNEYLGHSMVDMKTQGDSLFDIVDKRDHNTVQAQLVHSGDHSVSFFCRMNMSRTLKRQAGFGDVKVMHIRGRFTAIADSESNSPKQVFMAVCTPLITPDIKESLIQNNTKIFKSVHRLDMGFIEITQNGEFYLGTSSDDIHDKSWYSFIHPEDIQEAKEKHIQLLKSRHEMGCMLTVRMLSAEGSPIWVNIVMHVRQATIGNTEDTAVVCINQVISEQEAYQFKIQGQLFAFYASRTPDLLFGAQYGGAMVPSIEGNITIQPAPGFFNPPGYPPVGQPFENNVMEHSASPTTGLATPSQLLGVRHANGPGQVNGRQGHNDTLRALKRKIQENFNLSCRPMKIPKCFQNNSHENNNAFHSIMPNQQCSPNVNVYRNVFDNVPVSSGPVVMAQGPVHAFQASSHTATLSAKENCLTMNSVTSPPACSPVCSEFTSETTQAMRITEQVVPDIRVPDSFLTPEPSPVNSPQPQVDTQPSSSPTLLEPSRLSEQLEKLKATLSSSRNTMKAKPRQLPEIDATYVDAFFDDIDVSLIDGGIGSSRITPKTERTDCRGGQKGQSRGDIPMTDLNDMEDFFLSLDNFEECLSSPEPPGMSNDEMKPLLSDIKQELFFVPTPESETDFDSCDESCDMVPRTDVTLSLTLADSTSYNLAKDFPELPLGVEDELYQLKQLLSSLTPCGITEIKEETQ